MKHVRTHLSRWIGALAAAAVVFSGVIVGAPAAIAAPNPAIVVSPVTVESIDGGQATIGDILTLKGAWDATNADPQPGDTFTVGLPPELAFPEAIPFQLLGADGTIWGSCLTDPATGIAECTLSDAVIDRPEQVKGTFELEIEAVLATTEEALEFNLNGELVLVDLPGDGGISDGIVLPTDWDKSGSLNADKWSMTWTINVPGASLAGNDTVRILDDLGDNHVLCDPSRLRVQTVRGSTTTDVTSIAAIATDVEAPYDFAIDLTAPEGGFERTVTYRITYTTCTPDGEIDPKGTVYENEAFIAAFGERGQRSGVIGVTQDWAFSGTITKSGSVLGGAQRNGTIRWTVTVSGDHLVGKDAFTLADTLTGPHEVRDTTVSGIRVYERYGPSTVRQREITNQLDITPVSTTAGSFEASLAIKEGAEFAFQPLQHLYLITYETYATTDGLPESGTAFGNSATVDLATAGTETKVPGRSEGKGGAVNTSAVTLDGIRYFPQTTMNWSVRVPGQKLAALESDLTIVDTLTGAHEVCGTGEDVAARLGLRVQAIDQIAGGGLPTVDLTESATATLGVDPETGEPQFTVVVPRPTLALPGGGTETGFSREYQYLVTYTTCTTSGGMDAPGTRYGNTAELNGLTYTQSVVQNNRGSGTGEGVTRGSVSIAKSLADTPGAAFVADDTVFTVHVKEIDPQGTVQIEYDLRVPLNGDPVSGPNSRGTGWTAELSEPTFPSVPGVTFGTPRFAAAEHVAVSEDGAVATASLTPGANIDVSLTNTAQLGSLEVTKSVEGGAADRVDPGQRYSLTAAIDVSALGEGFPAQKDRTFTVTAGEPYVLADLPVGATVTLSETLPEDDDILTWSPATITPESILVEPGFATEAGVISVVNTVERTVGTFLLEKTVTGAQAENPAVPADVTVTATWTQDGVDGQKTLIVPVDGTPVPLGENLLIGTVVTLTETPLVDGSSIAWGAPVWSGAGVTVDGESAKVVIGRDAEALVSLENHAATSTAGIRILKGIAGAAADEVDPGVTFPVTATWTDAEGETQTRELEINAVEPTSLGEELPAGTVVTLTEGERPGIPTVSWGDIVITGTNVGDNGDGSATVIVSDLQSDSTLVTVLNEANWAPGTLTVAKSVEGIRADHPDLPETVTVVASWTEWTDAGETAQSVELTVPTDGTPVALGQDLPHLTEVTLTEIDPAHGASFTWALPEWSGDGIRVLEDGSALVTIQAATDAAIGLVNTAVPTLGDLTLVKALDGAGAGEVPAGTVFPVTVTWTDLLGDAQERAVEVRAGAETVVADLPIGVELTLVEREATLPDTVRWAGASWAVEDDTVTLAADGATATVELAAREAGTAEITLTNTIDEVPALAVTGGTFVWSTIAVLGALLLAAGAALVILRVRRTRAIV